MEWVVGGLQWAQRPLDEHVLFQLCSLKQCVPDPGMLDRLQNSSHHCQYQYQQV